MKNNDFTGFAIYITDNETASSKAVSFKAHHSTTVPQAEYMALEYAISAAQRLTGNSLILSDCLSAIHTAKKNIKYNKHTITISHVPAHVGINGNETADLLAKAGTTAGQINWNCFWNSDRMTS